MNYLIKKAINLNGNDLVMDTLDISYAKREIYRLCQQYCVNVS